MGVRTLVGEYDGTTPAAAMVDSASGFTVGPVFEGVDASERIDAFQEWLRLLPHVRDAEALDLTADDLPRPVFDGSDVRHWPDSGLGKLVTYHRRHEWEEGTDGRA